MPTTSTERTSLNFVSKRYCTSVSILLLWGCLVSTLVTAEDQYVSIVAPAVTSEKPNVPSQAISSIVVSINTKLLQLPSTTHINFLTPDGEIKIVKTRQEQIGKKGLVWHGKVHKDDMSIVTFSLVGEVIVGDIVTSRGKMYRIDQITHKVQLISKLSPAKFAKETRKRYPTKAKPATIAQMCPKDSGDRIDLMVLYTEAACKAANNAMPCSTLDDYAVIEAKINEAVGEANESYFRSSVNQRLSLVHMDSVGFYEEASYLEGHLDKDLERLILEGEVEEYELNTSDSLLDHVIDLRSRHNADVVVLLTKPTKDYLNCSCPDDRTCPSCGVSPPNVKLESFSKSQGFAVVPLDCATGNFSFTHELGHIMGANHDKEATSDDLAFPYSHGYFKANPTGALVTPWRTIMAYNNDLCTESNPTIAPGDTCMEKQGCIRIPYWSNQLAQHGADFLGAADADNRNTLNDTASAVANFLPASVCGKDVWMKDTWRDSGLEPDPELVGRPMWHSPYIWLRSVEDEDGGQLHAHEHENPEFGSDNWAYVKIHNGGFGATGRIELRFAKASTGLIWGDPSWKVLGTSETTLSANSTTIVPFKWEESNVPEPGHYCFVAEWISDSDRSNISPDAVLSDIVRVNNNVVWRNMNIVDLIPEDTVTSEVVIANPTEVEMDASIEVISDGSNGVPFQTIGNIEITLDSTLSAIWKKGGARSEGLKAGKGFTLISTKRGALHGLRLPPRFKGKLFLTISRPKSKPLQKNVYNVHIVQTRLIASKQVVFGGVSYEIRTGKQ